MKRSFAPLGRALCAALPVLVLGACLAGCSSAPSASSSAPASVPSQEDEPLKIVCTTFPLYDWARQLTEGSGAQLVLLQQGGTDLHSYQPTAQDILTITQADLFFYVGGESDAWVEQVLAQAPSQERQDLSAMELLADRLLPVPQLEGMEEEDHDHDHEEEADEHVWLSLKNARVACEGLSQALQEADEAKAELYQDNSQRYDQALKELDDRYTESLAQAPRHTLLVGDRFPFCYLAADYDLTCYAAFSGCSADSEASFETVAFLADRLESEDLPAVLILEGSSEDLASTIIRNTQSQDQEILVLDSMQAVSPQQVEAGASYLGLMEENLTVLQAALA